MLFESAQVVSSVVCCEGTRRIEKARRVIFHDDADVVCLLAIFNLSGRRQTSLTISSTTPPAKMLDQLLLEPRYFAPLLFDDNSILVPGFPCLQYSS